jgi:hypothetical protein
MNMDNNNSQILIAQIGTNVMNVVRFDDIKRLGSFTGLVSFNGDLSFSPIGGIYAVHTERNACDRSEAPRKYAIL